MASNSVELQEVTLHEKIIHLTLQGKHPRDIANELDISDKTVTTVIKKALDEAKEHFVGDAQSLLVKNFVRVDKLIDTLMASGLSGDLKAIDRIDRLIQTQIKMLTLHVVKPNTSENDWNGINNENVFTTSSPLYERALELAAADPEFEVTDGEVLFEEIEKKLESQNRIPTVDDEKDFNEEDYLF